MSIITAEVKGGVENAKRILVIGERVKLAIRGELKAIGIDLQGYIKTYKLSGDPLNRRSGNLSRSINEEVVEDANSITTIVGTRNTAFYGKMHEFGGSFVAHRTKLKVPSHLARRANGERVMTGTPYGIHFPERSYMRSSLAEQKASFVLRIERVTAKVIGGQ